VAAGVAGRRGLLVLLAVIVGVGYLALLAYLRWGDIPGLSPTATPSAPTPPVVELWDAYRQGLGAAQAEAQDARLVSASTQWQEAEEEELLTGAGNWSFVFYSPQSDNVLDVVVGLEEAQVVNRTRVWDAPQVLPEGGWEAGPRDALLVFMAYGAREFLEGHPQAVVDLHLAEGEKGPTWAVAALDVNDHSLLSLVIDVETLEVLSVAP